MAKILTLSQLGKHLEKLQGKQTESAFSREIGMGRHTLRSIKAAKHVPEQRFVEMLGFEIVYRQVK